MTIAASALMPNPSTRARLPRNVQPSDVERVEIERAPDVHALGAVVHLVEPAPQERHVVHRPVPGIDAEFEQRGSRRAICAQSGNVSAANRRCSPSQPSQNNGA